MSNPEHPGGNNKYIRRANTVITAALGGIGLAEVEQYIPHSPGPVVAFIGGFVIGGMVGYSIKPRP